MNGSLLLRDIAFSHIHPTYWVVKKYDRRKLTWQEEAGKKQEALIVRKIREKR